MNRRRWLGRSAGLLGGTLGALGMGPANARRAAAVPGAVPSETSLRAPQAQLQRTVGARALSGWSQTPLESLTGLLTPSDLHFERHHGGIPALDPDTFELLVHGLVETPKRFSLADLKRFPAVTRQYFIECSGNGYASTLPRDQVPSEIRPSDLDGLFSHSEWTGVPLKVLFEATGLKPKARWALAEGADSAAMSRSVPVGKLLDDGLLAYGQNGEALRPAQGYPVRLLLPGYEGNMSVKWLTRLELSDAPFMTREETSKYSDAQANGLIQQFSFVMGPKSLITSPAFPQVVPEPGFWEIRGLAWSGHGRLRRVEVSTDGGKHWRRAQLDGPDLPKAARLFRLGWDWDGRPAHLLSRAVDERGNRQQPVAVQMRGRGPGTTYHNNAIRGWQVSAGEVVRFSMDTRT